METLCMRTGISGMVPSISVAASQDIRPIASKVSAVGRSPAEKAAAPPQKTMSSMFSFSHPLKSLWPSRGGVKEKGHNSLALEEAVLVDNRDGGGDRSVVEEEEDVGESGDIGSATDEGQKRNWVLKILHISSLWKNNGEVESTEELVSADEDRGCNEECNACSVVVDGDDEEEEDELKFDRDSFSSLLRRVSLSEAKLYAQLSYLGHLAYSIPKIKPENLLKYRGLRFVTSSIEKRKLVTEAEKVQSSAEIQEAKIEPKNETESKQQKNDDGYRISGSNAYQLAAFAASYLQSRTKSILPFNSSKTEDMSKESHGNNDDVDNLNKMKSDVASLMATTDSVTAVVAAKEEVKQAVADDLKSSRSLPCEWFICDDDTTGTRFFVIQGSESLASWKANLLFEPVEFEGMDLPVHRGIYEAAKGMYKQMLDEVRAHLKSRGDRATFRFTGHSLGGSLSLLINLMLLIRGEVPASSLLPVITFGAPFVMCGGDRLLRKLGLPRTHIQAITMHRDIVPRAFSCNYPNHVARFLKAVNRSFRNHSCLSNQKLLYSPMGELVILQPDENVSPEHHLLPSGSGLYFLSCPLADDDDAEKHLQAAQMVFLNTPHPLEILSDRSAYGSEGTILRDHDMNSYVRSVKGVIRKELSQLRKIKREQRLKHWWPLVSPRDGSSVVLSKPIGSTDIRQEQRAEFSGILHTGTESVKRFVRLVASQHMHLLVVVLLPARLIVFGAYSVMGFR